jgi:Trypsin-like peptidase domain
MSTIWAGGAELIPFEIEIPMRVPSLLSLAGLLTMIVSGPSMGGPPSTGTGFAIGDGSLIVTAHHVVDGCAAIKIPDSGPATLLKSDQRSDLALLKAAKPISTGLRFRTGRSIKLGEEIVVIGYPLRGLLSSPPTVTTGIVSSLAGIRDDRTEMQISAPVQPGNSGGPVLDRSGNVVGVVESKLDAIKAAMVTGDIPQNVNFAIHSTIVTSLLDSYAINYDTDASGPDKPIAEIVAAALPAVVVIECTREEKLATPALPPKPPPSATPEPSTPTSLRNASLCGRTVDYAVDPNDSRSGFLGVWSGNWNNSGRLCGGLIVEKVRSDGTAELIYVYGPTQPGSKLAWKQQRRTGVLNNGKLSFQDDQGSTFVFDLIGSGTLNGSFLSGSGRLSGSFQKF